MGKPSSLKCDGMCKVHEGEVTTVHVVMNKPYHDWGNFNYCSKAIETDRKAGFTVIQVRAGNE